ncbi:MAG: endonuclease/exonuclease/phosphatase family protein [Bacteroidales bacterium]|nr:endonuclease/exonuclease/phosphatase family protein [Bacteroidales bacterium]
MKKVFLLLAAVVMLHNPMFAGKPEGKQTLTVMSYNIRNGEANDGTNSWRYRCPATIYMLRDQNPDIFGVQEAYSYQVEFITENLRNYKSVGVGREDGKKDGEHMSIFYNKKTVSLVKWGTFWLSETPEEPSTGWDGACRRTATWALMKCRKTGKKFYYVNTHLDHVGKTAQREGLALIVNRIAKINPEGYPMVLTGDFNVTPDDAILTDLDKIMQSCRIAAEKTDNSGTFNGWGHHSEVIDYIYISGFSGCEEFTVVRKPYADFKFISDHYPVKAELIF